MLGGAWLVVGRRGAAGEGGREGGTEGVDGPGGGAKHGMIENEGGRAGGMRGNGE